MEVFIQFPGQNEVHKMEPLQVYECFLQLGKEPLGFYKYKVGDGFGYRSTMCKTEADVEAEINKFPKDTLFLVQYHPAGIEFNPQIKTQEEIKALQECISNF